MRSIFLLIAKGVLFLQTMKQAFSGNLFRFYSLICFGLILSLPVLAQNSIGNAHFDERFLYAQTKQVNQFFKRFNAEEDALGKRLPGDDTLYHNNKLRMKYLPFLFDLQQIDTSSIVFKKFVQTITKKNKSVFLDFHHGEFYAEAACRFVRDEKFENILLFLRLEADRKGYKWVLCGAESKVYSEAFASLNDTNRRHHFLHPLSHEVDFMNLNKAFRDRKEAVFYTDKDFYPDYLSIFLFELASGRIGLVNVDEVKFHFLDVPGWYFELSWVERNSMNSGWLITNLLPIIDKDKDLLRKAFKND